MLINAQPSLLQDSAPKLGRRVALYLAAVVLWQISPYLASISCGSRTTGIRWVFLLQLLLVRCWWLSKAFTIALPALCYRPSSYYYPYYFLNGWPRLAINRFVGVRKQLLRIRRNNATSTSQSIPTSWAFFSNVSFRLLSLWLYLLASAVVVDSKLMRSTCQFDDIFSFIGIPGLSQQGVPLRAKSPRLVTCTSCTTVLSVWFCRFSPMLPGLSVHLHHYKFLSSLPFVQLR